jgi:hypothetical protein
MCDRYTLPVSSSLSQKSNCDIIIPMEGSNDQTLGFVLIVAIWLVLNVSAALCYYFSI